MVTVNNRQLNAKRRPSWGVILVNVAVYLVAAVFVMPFLISLLLSIKSGPEIAQSLLALPAQPHWENYIDAMQKAKILQSFKNSLILTGATVVLAVICSSMAGYAIGRFYHKRAMRLYETILMASLMLPFQTIMIPVYKIFKTTGMMNTIPGAVLVIAGGHLAFMTMLYIGFVKTIPREMEEAASIEGYGLFRTFFRVIFPLLKSITFTVATLTTLWTWNEFNVSLIVLQKDAVKTIPMQQYVFFSQYSAQYNLAFAAAVISMIPVVLFFIFAQKYIVKGLTEGAVKG